MGVPSFFRWLVGRYPKVIVDCKELVEWKVDGVEVPVDACQPNPNGREYDNLYLDMNGIIHPCTHPEDKPAPTTEEEMFTEIFRYVDRLMRLVRPRKLVYFAIDGVAPRAKINQQRSRRFRAAQEADEKARLEDQLRTEWAAKGLAVPPRKENEHRFDSNVITPGTPFMQNLSVALRKYIAEQLRQEPAWRRLKIVFSDSSVPGEGEHKVADFIRQQRLQNGYDANVQHVLYGLDADLIMLALATHELHFTILREKVFLKGKPGPMRRESPATGENGDTSDDQNVSGLLSELGGKTPFQFLSISVLREYLHAEFYVALANNQNRAGLVYDLERVIDDFVFMCFFVGNDFLPHMPVLDIREGALDFLIALYKKLFPSMGYITDGMGDVDFEKARTMLREVGMLEDEVFQKRMEAEKRQRLREEEEQKAKDGNIPGANSRKFSREQESLLESKRQRLNNNDLESNSGVRMLRDEVFQKQTESENRQRLSEEEEQNANAGNPAATDPNMVLRVQETSLEPKQQKLDDNLNLGNKATADALRMKLKSILPSDGNGNYGPINATLMRCYSLNSPRREIAWLA